MEILRGCGTWKLYRFTCECTSPGHSLDLSVDHEENEIYLSFGESYIPNRDTWIGRIRNAVKVLLGREISLHEVFLTLKDLRDLVSVLQEAELKTREFQKPFEAGSRVIEESKV